MSGFDMLYGEKFLQNLAEQKPFFATQSGPLLAGLARGEYALYLSGLTADSDRPDALLSASDDVRAMPRPSG